MVHSSVTTIIRDLEFSYLPTVNNNGETFNGTWIINNVPETTMEFYLYNMERKEKIKIIINYKKSILTQTEVVKIVDEMIHISNK